MCFVHHNPRLTLTLTLTTLTQPHVKIWHEKKRKEENDQILFTWFWKELRLYTQLWSCDYRYAVMIVSGRRIYEAHRALVYSSALEILLKI